ncbi:MAG: hypothetical protein V7459_02905 [Oceanicoccus sp.]
MSIQEIALSHNLKKKLLKSIDDENIIFRDDNGDVVVSVENYLIFKQDSNSAPLEAVLGDDILDFDNQYFLFS